MCATASANSVGDSWWSAHLPPPSGGITEEEMVA
jgi:hypothetical protein